MIETAARASGGRDRSKSEYEQGRAGARAGTETRAREQQE
jgi:hypothetical protein